VDINGMAVELAKLSLWLATMQPGQPLSFLDHHLKEGNSLLGATLEEIVEILSTDGFNRRTPKVMKQEAHGQQSFRSLLPVQQTLAQTTDLLERISARKVEQVIDVERQEADYEIIQSLLRPYKTIGDLLVAQKAGLKANDDNLRRLALALEADAAETLSERQRELLAQARTMLGSHRPFHWPLEFPQVLLHQDCTAQSGFDVVIGNPPFLGGLKISTEMGESFLRYLKSSFAPASGMADLCAYFFRRAFSLLKPGCFMGLVATNTIGQGDTRETGLDVIASNHGAISYADRFVPWAGDAVVEVNLVAICREPAHGTLRNQFCLLDGRAVPFITSRLDDLPHGNPARLATNQGKAFIGDYVRGIGFVLEPGEAAALLRQDPRNKKCIFPYLNGRDINAHPEQQPSRYVVCFHEWSYEDARQYKEPFRILQQRVKPQRDKVKQARDRHYWWQFSAYRHKLREAVKPLQKVLARSRISEIHALVFVPKQWIANEKTIIFAYDDYYHFAILQSNIHESWMRRFTSTLRTDINYAPSDCLVTFPFPAPTRSECIIRAEDAGRVYYEHRQNLMTRTQLGLTKTYNRLHDPAWLDEGTSRLRELHADMDRAILACYGWEDIEPEHGFHRNDRNKIRFMPSPAVQREILTRLMALNQQTAAQEAAQGLVTSEEVEDEESNEDGLQN
jgi:hypothetical protein